MKILRILLIVILIIRSATAQQIKSFTPEPEKFIKELEDFFGSTAKKKEGKDLVDAFAKIWKEGKLTEEQKKRIYATSNKMLKKRATAFPHFESYINILMIWEKSNKSMDFYDNWEKILWALLDDNDLKIRDVEEYINLTAGLVEANYVCRLRTIEWKANTDQYKLIMDNKKIKVIFEKDFTLTCYAKRDSATIYKTKGIFDLMNKKWYGINGKVTWERAGFKPNDVYAHLHRYEIDMTKTYYSADSVEFVNVFYFNKPLLGVLDEKVRADVSEESATYPKFESYTKRFFIKSIFPDVDFDGGFRMEGADFIGTGDEKKLAMLNFYRKDTLFLTAQSCTFIFKKEQVVGKNSMITIRLDKDSIFHPGLIFRFLIDKREVSLLRTKEGMERSSYFNSYHKLDMDVALATWKMDEPRITFTMTILSFSTDRLATFESSDYFAEKRYNYIQGIDEVNPLYSIKKYSQMRGIDKFSAEDFTMYLGKSFPEVSHTLMLVSYMGFISYNVDKGEVIVLDRLNNYLDSYAGKRDYDVISFYSEPDSGLNASLNLLNYDLTINGVQNIQLSDSQAVIIYPEEEKIILKKNRDFEFHGKVEAGLFTFFGSNFSFEYNKFKINLNNVDKLQLKVLTGEIDMYGSPLLEKVRTDIEQVHGDLLIDAPNNKSGRKDYPEYPIFNSRKDSYVYYDKRNKYDNVYPRDKFYFQIYPYSIDSLDNFTKEGIDLDGYFVSSGIFPPFEESLKLQPDFSLGFVRKTQPGGFPMYGGKGSFNNDINLSNQGLRGDGELKYIASTTYSDDFVFFPDSMNTHTKKFIVTKTASPVPFPDVQADALYVHWMPYQDELFATKETVPLKMYEDQAIIHGTLRVQPDGLTGWGRMEFVNAELTSDLFVYNENTFDADTSRFNLKSLDIEDFSFKTENVNSHIDFVERKGTFKSNGAASFVEFPRNQYICFMDQFNWYMDKEEIEISASRTSQQSQKPAEELSPTELEDIQLSGSQFISIHPNQDSLEFTAPSAKYSLNRSIINATDVKYIRIGDATCYLDEKGEVTIEKKAKMRTLENTKIQANNTTKYHLIYNATTNIFGKNEYNASGDYDYIDENKQNQTIHFDLVALDTTIQTYATGKIGITDGFKLSPYFEYAGKVRLNANSQYLTFNGSTKLVHECDTLPEYFINFESEINPNEIYIPFYSDSTTDINNNKLYSGFYITSDSTRIYTAFCSKRGNYSDVPLLVLNGYIFYDKKGGKYIISNKEKIIEPNLPGDYLSFHKSFCILYGEGKVSLGTKFEGIETISVGNINNSLNRNNFDFDILLGLNFYFYDKCLELMAKILTEATGLEGVDVMRSTYIKGLTELFGVEVAEKLRSELALGSIKKLPKELQSSIFLNYLNLKWDTKTNSYLSADKIGIGNIGKIQVNRLVDGYLQVVKKRGNDQFTLYFKVGSNWFYFSYKAGLLSALSSDEEFNKTIQDLKPGDRTLKDEKGTKYSFYTTGPKQVKNLLKRFEPEEPEEGEGEKEDSGE
ncbi:MAG: hypothetical protein HY738_15555 [Bacteroidia bacterium]|nr:hypothetical protein [Bacteroidia bacterium]